MEIILGEQYRRKIWTSRLQRRKIMPQNLTEAAI